MKKILFILSFLFGLGGLKGQVIFKINVSPQTITEGQSFTVQYILEEGEIKDQFFPPDFKGFLKVSGPYVNNGSVQPAHGTKRLRSIGFTLIAPNAGRYRIPAATAKVNGIIVKSDNAVIEVISKKAASDQLKEEARLAADEDYFLRPGEDPYEKMRQNLFIRVAVNKKTCYAGEPVIATYKLYSRLQSKSDIVKNPGFYGFTVQDMVNLDDKILTTEMINGKSFDVHTIRKVQLFPLQAGKYTIDEMEVENKVVFSKSFVRERAEQEIEEGVYDHSAELPEVGNTVTFENSMHTEPVAIHVKPVPVIDQPKDYTGATGNFEMTATLDRNRLDSNQEGNLVITVTGKGNFTQVSAPLVVWPKGIEGFEAIVKDELDKTQSPLTGKRTFRFPFTITTPGDYILPTIRFSYFNPDSNHYKIINTKPLKVTVFGIKENKALPGGKTSKPGHTNMTLWMIAGLGVMLSVIVLLLLKRKSKNVVITPPVETKKELSIDEILQASQVLLGADNKSFYAALRNNIWIFLDQHFGLKGSDMNKYNLRAAMQLKNVSSRDQEALLAILGQCEAGIFTNAESTADKKELLDHTRSVLTKLDQHIRKGA